MLERKTRRSELARDGLENDACIQDDPVIVNDHREQARSYRWAKEKPPINQRLIGGF
ncbi:hypothetical protein D3C84_1119040 [compost metagenome]